MTLTHTIPVLDLEDFQTGRRDRFVEQVGQALETIGFFALVNHGVDAGLIQRAYQAAADFFQLPESVKRRYEDPALNGQRGFVHFGKEHAKDNPYPDLKEFWHVGRSFGEAEVALYPPNLVPLEVPEFHPLLSELYNQLESCALSLLQACALYLGEPLNLLADPARSGDTILRVIHYPPIPPEAHPASVRSAPHEDINLITLLCGATDDGLELLQRDGSWLAVPAIAGQIIVDSGDMLQQITNGLFKSTTHRVVNPTDERSRRFSMPFFVHPNPATDLTPLPGCIARSEGVQKFPAITAGEYLLQRLREIGLID
ncbi:MAG TPA: isopenicillin N synthase family oxygenase [Leptolyngbyaceae cyanobacterium M33_DOE_097]|uniref:Isopenicillin N synthase family oxygenase n=1 Tax=Oscillatoriales cyanobacterium SpSt-418 TaxID=2282169 RepID=A0A7C3PK13_9CYAN|nr:isopenicillin N synthase family oxygenase [Leptolyngbyaceae cyanobacterium M33_DOE_097]